jgi:ribonuclease P protein component
VAPVVTDARRAARSASDLAIVDAAAFDRCLAQRALVRSGAFAIHLYRHGLARDTLVRPAAESCADDWRLGLVIPKRYEASAVARNTIKRRWRGAFRQGCVQWAVEFGGADLVVRLSAPLAAKTSPMAQAPARVRGRDTFDPQAIFGQLTARLRGQPAARSPRAPSAVSQ